MASESPSILRGILVPDRRISTDTLWAAESDYTQAGPVPGVAEPQQDTAMDIQVSGSQSSGGALRVRAANAGFPERDGATFVWQQEGDTDWRGWDPPSSISSFESIDFPGAASLQYRNPHAVALDSGIVLVASSSTVVAATNVRIHTRTAAGAWSTASIHTEAPDGTNEPHPALVVLPSGRVLCMFLVYDGTANLAQVRVYSSDDDGATWSEYQRFALREAIDTSTVTVQRMRAAYSGGQIALVMEWDRSGLLPSLAQYASRDLGASFSQVLVLAGIPTSGGLPYAVGSGRNHDIAAVDGGGFVLLWQPAWTATYSRTETWRAVLTSAYDSRWLGNSEVTELPWAYASYLEIEHTLVPADDGALYVLAVAFPRTSGDTPYGQAVVSYDNGQTFERIGRDLAGSTDGRWFWPAVAGTAHPQRFHGCWHRGRILLAHNADDAYAPTVDPDALWAAYLGGYTTATMPSLDTFVAPTNSLAWFWEWHPYELPTAVGATALGTATSEVLDSELTVSVAALGTRYYRGSLVTGMSIAGGMMSECEFSTTDNVPVGLRLRLSDNTNDYHVDIQVQNTTVEVYDLHSAAQIGSTETVASGDRVTVRIAVAAGKVWAGFKVDGQDEDRDWTVIANGVALTDNGAGAGVIYWAESGRTIADPKVSTFKWYSGRVTRADDVGGIAEGFTNPDDLRGRPFSGQPVYVEDGTSIAAISGPCARDDEWDVDVRHDYGVENIHPWESESPRIGWRSTSAPVGQNIAWKVDEHPLASDAFDSGLFAIYLDGINFPTFRLDWTDNNPTAWTTAADVDLRESGAFVREGANVAPATTGGAVSGPYIHRDELVGGWFEFPSGEVRPILSNSEGHWSSGPVTQKRPHLVLGDIDDTESVSGTGYIWFPRAVVILHNLDQATAALRMTIRPSGTVPAPPDGYYKAGVIAMGNVAVFGRSYGFGHRTRYFPNVEIEEMPSGIERSRKRGPRRREMAMRWDTGLITRSTRGTEQSDYVKSTTTSTPPVASARDVQWLLEGLDSQMDGPLRPGVLLPFIPAGTPDVVTHTWQRTRGAIYGRMSTSPAMENTRGTEEVNELMRTGFTWREIV